MIVGTAGHIDHGKTTLVRTLTGVDTDRLKEEKARGISIELGYAYVPVDGASDDILGFVDVPGHERLVHTMVAGASGIDFALLVVAADDGVMPQTREHVAILASLGIGRGAVALTKVDRVEIRRCREVEAAIRTLLSTTPLREAPIFAVNGADARHTGTIALSGHLHAEARQASARRADGLFRLAIDRVFTLAGHGTIVAGTVVSGTVSVGDSISIMPQGKSARVRSLHAHNRPAASGRAGQRCALNLAGIEKSEVARGDWLADARALAPATRIDARLSLFAGGTADLTQWSPLHVHFGTTHRTARVVLLDAERLAAGASASVQFVFDAPVCATPGDRFIVRDAQAAHTVGGGILLDPFAPARKRRSGERMRFLDALQQMTAGDGIAPLLRQAPHGLRLDDLLRLTGQPPGRLVLPEDARIVDAVPDRHVILREHWLRLRERTLAVLGAFHASTPDETGADSGRLRRIVAPALAQPLWLSLIEEMARDGALARSGPLLRLPSHAVALSADEESLARKVLPLIAAGRADPPWVRDVATTLRAPEESVRRVLRKLLARGAVHQVVRDLFYDPACVDALADTAADLARRHGNIDVAAFRDAVGLGRKRSVQILEFFDRVGYTRRVADSRILRKDSGWRQAGAAVPQAGT